MDHFSKEKLISHQFDQQINIFPSIFGIATACVMLHAKCIVTSKFRCPYKNLALEQTLRKRMKSQASVTNIVYLSRSSKHISIGTNQDCWSAFNMARARSNNIPIVRRRTGGGAYYADPGVFSFTFLSKSDYWNFGITQLALLKLGYKPNYSDRMINKDIIIDGHLVSNYNQDYDDGGLFCHSGTILISADLEEMTSYFGPNRFKNLVDIKHSEHCDAYNWSSKFIYPHGTKPTYKMLEYGIIESYDFFYSDFSSPVLLEVHEDNVHMLFPEFKHYYDNLSDPKFVINYHMVFEYSMEHTFLDNNLKGTFKFEYNLCKYKITKCRVTSDTGHITIPMQLEEIFTGRNILVPYASTESFYEICQWIDTTLKDNHTRISNDN